MLWEKHLAAVPTDEIELTLAEALAAVEDTEMNGRSEGSKLKLEYLQTIVQVWNEFEISLLKLQNVDMLET